MESFKYCSKLFLGLFIFLVGGKTTYGQCGDCSDPLNLITYIGNEKFTTTMAQSYFWEICEGNSKIIGSNTDKTVNVNCSDGMPFKIRVSRFQDGKCIKACNVYNIDCKDCEKPSIELIKRNYDPKYPIEYDIEIKNALKQGINNVIWQKVSGRGTITQNQNIYSANVGGGVVEWILNGKVTASNTCGTTSKNFTVSGGGRPPCDRRYEIVERTKGNYGVQRRPCPDRARSFEEKDLPKRYQIKVYNSTGQELLESKSNTIDLSGFDAGPYILKAVVDDEVIINKILLNY